MICSNSFLIADDPLFPDVFSHFLADICSISRLNVSSSEPLCKDAKILIGSPVDIKSINKANSLSLFEKGVTIRHVQSLFLSWPLFLRVGLTFYVLGVALSLPACSAATICSDSVGSFTGSLSVVATPVFCTSTLVFYTTTRVALFFTLVLL